MERRTDSSLLSNSGIVRWASTLPLHKCYGIVDNTMSGQRQIAQPVEIVRRKHLLGRPPTPIPFGPTRYIHAGLRAQTKNILQVAPPTLQPTTMRGGGGIGRPPRYRPLASARSSRPSAAARGADPRTSPVWCCCHAYRCTRRSSSDSCAAGKGSRNRRRRRIAVPECPESGIDRGVPRTSCVMIPRSSAMKGKRRTHGAWQKRTGLAPQPTGRLAPLSSPPGYARRPRILESDPGESNPRAPRVPAPGRSTSGNPIVAGPPSHRRGCPRADRRQLK